MASTRTDLSPNLEPVQAMNAAPSGFDPARASPITSRASSLFNQIDQNNQFQSIDVSFGRSSPVKFYSYFVMALM